MKSQLIPRCCQQVLLRAAKKTKEMQTYVVDVENTIVVVFLKLLRFSSSHNVSCIRSVHQEKPQKDS
jgi:hypothetical protein